MNDRCCKQAFGLTAVVVSAKEERGRCEICDGPMKVQKTYRHEGRTLRHGMFEVCETVYVCAGRCHHPVVTIHTPIENAMRNSLLTRQIDFNLIFSHCEE